MKLTNHLLFSSLRAYSFGQIISTVLNFIITLVLLRLVAPHWFGLIAMVIAFSGVLGMLPSLGTHVSLVQTKSLNEADKSTVFYWNLLSGGLGGLVVIFSQSFFEWFYQTTFPAFLCPLIALELWLSTLVLIPSALLQREMAFKKLWQSRIAALFIGGVIAIGLALAGLPLWAILIRPIAVAFSLLILLFVNLKWYPKGIFSKKHLLTHLSFGSAITADSLLGYGVRNVDDIIVGRWMGAQALGFYTKAYSTLLFPLRKLSRIVGNVYFPAFAKIQDRPKLLGRIYMQLCTAVSSYIFPLMGWVFLETESIVWLLMGEAWLPSVPIIKVFVLLGALQSIGTFSGMLYQSTGRAHLQMRIGLVFKPLIMISIIITGWYFKTPLAVALAYGISSFIALFPEQYYAIAPLNISFQQLAGRLFPAFIVTFLSVLALSLCPFDVFILRTLIFFSFYLLLYRMLFPSTYFAIRDAIRKIFKLA